MALEEHVDAQAAVSAARETIPTLLASSDESALRSLLDNPAFDETHVCLLLQRKDLSGLLLEEISKRKIWRAAYRVRLGLAAHPHTPRLIAMRLLRELHLMDLVRISLLTSSSMELRRLAEERILTQLAQLPLGQKIMLARRRLDSNCGWACAAWSRAGCARGPQQFFSHGVAVAENSGQANASFANRRSGGKS